MKCKNETCSNDSIGRSQYCSGTCKTVYNRNKSVTVTPESVTIPAVTSESVTSVTRTNPDALNYGKPMSLRQLDKAGLKANRVPIPGDHDYSGVCVQVDGKWRAKSDRW